MAALAQEVARSTPELKEAFQSGFEKILAESGRESTPGPDLWDGIPGDQSASRISITGQ